MAHKAAIHKGFAEMIEEVTLPCAEKLAFDTKQQARAAATTALYQHGTKLKVYLCKHCHLWHLSSV